MVGRWSVTIGVFLMGLEFLLFSVPRDAQAIPSFARQSGMECAVCHTLWPELTPFGRYFKLTGYTISKSYKKYEWPPPLAGLLQLSYTRTQKDQPSGSIPQNWATQGSSHENDAFSLPQSASLFYGGRIFDQLGAFIQGTYDGAENNLALDNTDIRFAHPAKLLGRQVIYGVTVNNNPTLPDVWNSTPAFGYPYATSSVAPAPAASPLIYGILAQQIAGIGAYALWDNTIYLGTSIYQTTDKGITSVLGAGTTVDNYVDGTVPYWRLVFQKQGKRGFFSVGNFGLVANIYPSGLKSGPSDRFTDIGFDAQYQYVGTKHSFTGHALWIYEQQDRTASYPLGSTANSSDYLITYRIQAHYHYRSSIGEWGGTMAYFSTTGKRDSLLYAPTPLNGSRTGLPDSDGFLLEFDYLPFKEKRLFLAPKISLQYTIYNRFNGAENNYDGYGRNASDNNTLYLLFWLMF